MRATIPTLADALEFTVADLAANQRGELGVAQRARIEGARAAWRSVAVGSRPIIIGLGIVCVGAATALGAYALVYGEHQVELLFTAGVMAFSGAATILRPEMLSMSVPTLPTHVEVVEGVATLGDEEGAGWGARVYFVQVGGRQFDVGSARIAFIPGRAYRCYYVTTAHAVVGRSGLLSAEEVC